MLDPVAQVRAYMAQLRAGQPVHAGEQPGQRIGSILLDHARRELRGTVSAVRLTAGEYALARRLSLRVGIIVERDDLILAMYADDPDGGPESAEYVLRARIMRLRQMLRQLGADARIETHRSVGYSMETAG